MGFFDSLVSAASDASEIAHGKRILKEFDDSIRLIAPLIGRDEVIRQFLVQRTMIRREMQNWSRDGTLSKATALRKDARQTFDLNVVEGYSLWLTSAWLEASVRRSAEAQHVWQQLEQLATQHDAIREDEEVAARLQRYLGQQRENERRLQTERATKDALDERKNAADTLSQAVESRIGKLRRNLQGNESAAMSRSLRKAVRRIVEIGFKTTSAPDLRHVNWQPDTSEKVIACCVGFGISSAEAAQSEPALHIALSLNYLETQGCGKEMRKYYTGASIDAYYFQPETKLGALVRVARDAMDAFIDGSGTELEELKAPLN